MLRILVDLDGTLADFDRGFLTHYGRPLIRDNWPKGKRNCLEVLNLTHTEFWDNVPRLLFKSLPEMSDMEGIIKLVKQYDPLFAICSSQGGDERGHHDFVSAEKAAWIREHIDPTFTSRRMIFTGDKSWCASPYRILIDDQEEVVKDFRLAGGNAILLPRPWNNRHSAPTLSVLEMELQHLFTPPERRSHPAIKS